MFSIQMSTPRTTCVQYFQSDEPEGMLTVFLGCYSIRVEADMFLRSYIVSGICQNTKEQEKTACPQIF